MEWKVKQILSPSPLPPLTLRASREDVTMTPPSTESIPAEAPLSPPTPRCPCSLRPHAANAAQCPVRRAVVPPLAGGGGSLFALVPGFFFDIHICEFIVVFMLNM